MKLCVLHPSYERSQSAFKGLDPACDPGLHMREHQVDNVFLHKGTGVAEVQRLARAGYDCFINLCDGSWDEDRSGIEVVQALERLELPFTGAGSRFYDPSREVMKLAAGYAGLDTPAFAMVRDETDLAQAAELRFPLIVKHPNSYSSLGMTPASRVTNCGALATEVRRMTERFGGALVEEFIEGREFTLLVTEPREGEEASWVLAPLECRFPPGESFKHFQLKWLDYGAVGWLPVPDEALRARLCAASSRFFAALQGSGYGRCDARVDHDGRIFILEINPNCGLFYPEGHYGSADEIVARDPGGHRGLLEHLLMCAQRRCQRARRAFEIRFRPGRGFILHASRDLREGEVIDALEERAQHLVTLRHVERVWGEVQRECFERYAYPITSEVYGMWSDHPQDWRPYEHSCEPSAWLEGLNVVARRPLRRGEEISLDYATFCGPLMRAFTCRCGAPNCRGRITGADNLAPFVERYGDHVSDYVRRVRSGLSP